MKKLAFILAIVLVSKFSYAQVFGSAQTLSPKKVNLSIIPFIYDAGGNNDLALFLQGGYGLKPGIDFALKLGLFENENYFGGDVEFAVTRNLSLGGGFHSFGSFAMDLTGLYTIRLTSSARLTTGLDFDIYTDSNAPSYLWIPVNTEIDLKKNLSFIFEAGIDSNLLDQSYNYMAGGLQFYF